MKKLLALLMAVALTFQLVTPVFADTVGTEETTVPTEAVVETEAPTEAPAEETTAPAEGTTAPTEETSAPTEATEETEEAPEATEETVEDIALFADDGDVIASGECGKNGDNLTWVLTGDGTLTISGSGEMNNYSTEYQNSTQVTTAPWCTYLEQITAVVMEPGVASIGSYAFYKCGSLINVTIPEGVVSIGKYAFSQCSLTSVMIPEGVTSIGDSAFSNCSLTSVTIPEGVISIGRGAFWACYNLTSVKIPESVTSIGSYAFNNCQDLTSITIPNGVTSISDYVFYACFSLTSVAIPEGVTSVGEYAFTSCRNLKHVYYGGSDLQWKEIEIGSGNDTLTNAIIRYGSTHIHNTEHILRKASCTEVGNIEYWRCLTCGEYFTDEDLTQSTDEAGIVLPAVGHTMAKTERVEPGCTTDGSNAYYTCSVCNKAFKDADGGTGTTPEAEILPALGHDIVYIEASEPTYWNVGNNAYYACSRCGMAFKDVNGETETTVKDETLAVLPSVGCGTCGDNLNWALTEDGTLTISGSGEMKDYSTKNQDGAYRTTAPWGTYWEQITAVVIEPGVTGIGKFAFYGCSSLASVTISDGVTSIGEYTFENCSSLTSVLIPEGVTSIGASAFRNCSSLTSVTIPDGITSIGKYTFEGCSSLTSVTLPASVTSIGYYAFNDCTALKDIYYGGSSGALKRMCSSTGVPSDCVFHGETVDNGTCGDNLTWVLGHDGVLTISGSGEMGNYSNKYQNGEYRTTAPWGTYWEQITAVVVESGITCIGDYAFYECSNLTSAAIPQGVTSIGSWAFCGCGNLTNAAIPEGVTSIGAYAFEDCSSLISVTIPEGVTGISMSSFSGCSSLTNVAMPEGVTSIGDAAFSLCSSLTRVTIPEGVTSIGVGAFSGCSNLTSVTIPESVASIGDYAFSRCGLTSVSIPKSVTEIACGAFRNCTNLEDVILPEGLLSIASGSDYDDGAFGGCTSLKSIVIPASVTSIGSHAFSGCSSLTSVTIPEGVTEIARGTFYGCSNLTSVTIPESVTSVGSSAFGGCTSLNNIVIPTSVTSIEGYAFSGCTSLHNIAIPASVTIIESDAFRNCPNLTDITFAHCGRDTLSIGSGAFDFGSRPSVNVFTVVHVPNVKTIHTAIKNYKWSSDYREVGFVGDDRISMEAITISTKDGGSEYEVGIPVEFSVVLEPTDTTDDYTWAVVSEKTTADTRVSKDGVLTTLSAGTVTVRAQCVQDPAVFDEITVTILPPTGTATSLTVTTLNDYPGDAELGKPVQMIPVFTPANAADRNVTWSLENGTGTATIDENGLLTPLTVGTVTVYAMTASGIEGSCTVNIVRYAEEITILLNGKEDLSRFGIGENAELSFRLSPEDTTTKEVEWSVVNKTGSAKLYSNSDNDYARLEGQQAGNVILTATAKDSKRVVATKELTITDTVHSYALPDGSGNLYYNAETGWITGADKTVKNALIPAQINGVTIVGIDPYVFADRSSYSGWVNNDNTTLTSVSIPNTMEEIGESAFKRCTALSSLRFAPGSRLKTIGEDAFYQCESITSLTIPDSVESIGSNAFYGLKNLKYLTMSGEMDGSAWFGDRWLSLDTLTLTGTYVLGGKVKRGDDYFWCSVPAGRNARKVILSEGITSIGEYAFNSCQDLKELVLPVSLQTIGAYAFNSCQSLEKLALPAGLQTIGAHAFEECRNLVDVTIPDSLQTLGEKCFEDCDKLQLIDMSKVPDTFIERETSLTGMAAFPDWLVRATKGKAEIGWDLYQTDVGYGTVQTNCADVFRDWGTQQWYLYARESGKCYIVCQDTYTGIRGSKEIEIKTGIVIRPADTGYLVSGSKLALSAWNMPAESRADVDWSLAPGSEEYASIDYRGNLTAKTVYAAQQITVIAQPYDGGDRVTKNIWILPKTTGLGLMLDGAPLGSTLNVDQAKTETLQLSAKVYPDGALQEMQWTSTASGVARVDENGLVTLVKPGVTIIKAATKDGSRLTAQVTLNVTYVDSAGKLTLTAGEMPEIGLQPGQTVRLTLRGEQAIPYESVVFSVPSNQSTMGSVDENGLFTAGKLTGRVDVTAALKDDPLGRTASISIQVIPVQAAELALTAELPEENLLDGTMIFDRTELNRDVIFPITAKAFDRQGGEVAKDILWSSSDTSIAKVDFEGNVTVKAGANGYCAITATAQDLAMVSETILISVRDYAPRLDASTLNLNTASTAGVDVALVESFGNAIEKVTVNDTRFQVSYENNLLTLTAREAVARGNYAMTLEAVCGNGRIYTYPITVKASQTLPKLTVKQNEKFNLFYRDSQATLTITGGEVESAELTGNSDFVLENEDGEWVIRYADPANVPAKPSTKATLSVSFAGYNTPVTKALTISTVNTAPRLTLNPTSSTLNTALNADWSVETVLAGAEGENLYAYTDTPGVDVELSGNVLTLTLTEAKNVSASVYVQDENWTKPVKLTHRITVTSKLPTLKAATGTLKLNSWFPSETASTGMVLSQGNVFLSDVELTPAAKEGTSARVESDKLNVYYDADSGEIVAEISDSGIKNGTYSFTCTGILENGTEISGGTVRVTVSNTLPKAKLSASMVKLNRQLAGEEAAAVTVSLTGGDGYTIEGFEELPDCLDYADGILTATIPDADFTGGSYVLNAIVSRNGETATLSAGVNLRVQVYDKVPSFRLVAKGKLDVLNPASEIVYTPKLTNAQGTVTDIRLEGADAELFAAEVTDGIVHLTMAEGCEYSTKVTYKVTPILTFCGQEVTGSVLSIRVSQSVLRLAALPNRTVYQSQTVPLVQTLSITSPATAEIGEITLNSKSTAALWNAVEAAGGIEVSGGVVRFPATAFASLKPGRYTVILDIAPENAAIDAKPIQARFTLTVQK